jgi:cytochrome c oxidase subunit 2
VAFQLESRDVLHSFWVPSLRLKQDAVPGRTIHGWFRATKTGTFDISCAEICGTGHTSMRAALVVQTPEEFDRWVAAKGQVPGSPQFMLTSTSGSISEVGHALAQQKACLACHSVDGSRIVGPSWLGLFGKTEHVVTQGQERDVVVNEAYLRRSILEPMADIVKGYPPAMPPQRTNVTDAQVTQLVEYIKSLGKKEK